MKKLLTISLSILLCLSIFTGCTSNDDEIPSDDNVGTPTDDITPDDNVDTPTDNLTPDDDMSDNNATSSEYKDGIYIARAKDAVDGFRDYVKVTVENGEINSVEFDGEGEEGNLKTTDEEYRNSLDADNSDMYPDVYMKGYSDSYMASFDLTEVMPITGAEDSHEVFTNLMEAALDNARQGNEEEIIVAV